MLTLEDCLTSSGKYPWRAKHKECTEEVKDNALDFTTRVNAFFYEMGVKDAKYTSGFRPSEVNKKAGGAKKSHHTRGCAGDFEDADRTLALACMSNQELMAKHGLYMEDPSYTATWVHLQSVPPRSGKRIFIP